MASPFFFLPVLVAACFQTVDAARDTNDFFNDDGLDSEEEHMKLNQRLSAQMGVQLMAEVGSFLATEVSAKEKDHIRQTARVASLEKRGFSLEEQFRLYFLMRAPDFGLAKPNLMDTTNPELSPLARSLMDITEPTPKSPELDAMDVSDDATHTGGVKTCPVPVDKVNGKGCTEQPEMIEKLEAKYSATLANPMNETETEKLLTETNLNLNHIPAAGLKLIKDDIGSYIAIDELLADESLYADFDVPLSQSAMTQDAYRRWKKRQARKTKAWFHHTRNQLKEGLRPENATTMKELYQSMIAFSDNLADIDTKVNKALDTSWQSVEKSSNWLVKSVRHWFVATALNIKHAVMAVWNTFKAALDKAEVKCSKGMQEEVKKVAKTTGMKSREQLVQMADGPTDRMQASMDTELGKAATTMKDISDQKRGSEEQADRGAAALKEHYKSITDEARAGSVDQEKVTAAKDEMANLENHACAEKQNKVSGVLNTILHSLKQALNSIKKIGKAAMKMTIPAIAMRGFGGFATSLVGGYGFEEVINFRNREIGYFTYGATQVGTSSASVGGGGYIGLGSLGYKANWSLEDLYITAVYTSTSISANFFGVSPGLGITFCLDADNSAGSPWVPEPQGCNGVDLGWSQGVGLSLPINLGLDVGQSLYHMFVSECFESKSKFLAGILAKWCSSCYSGVETLAISALRVGTWAAGFPFISDTVFTVLWMINEMMREDEWEQHCSASSTKLRDDSAYMARTIAQKIDEAHASLKRIRDNSANLVKLVTNALAVNEGENIKHSEEIKLVSQLHDQECLDGPPHLKFAEGSSAIPLGLRTKEEIKKTVAGWDETYLVYYCNEMIRLGMDIHCKKGTFGTLGALRKRVRMKIAEVSNYNRFGKCNAFWECEKYIPNSECTFPKLWQKVYGSRGDCRCKPGFCYSGAGRDDTCVPKITPEVNESLHIGVEIWMHQREIELGSYSNKVQQLIADGTPQAKAAKHNKKLERKLRKLGRALQHKQMGLETKAGILEGSEYTRPDADRVVP